MKFDLQLTNNVNTVNGISYTYYFFENRLVLQWSIVIDRRKYLKLDFYSIFVAYPEIMKGYIL